MIMVLYDSKHMTLVKKNPSSLLMKLKSACTIQKRNPRFLLILLRERWGEVYPEVKTRLERRRRLNKCRQSDLRGHRLKMASTREVGDSWRHRQLLERRLWRLVSKCRRLERRSETRTKKFGEVLY